MNEYHLRLDATNTIPYSGTTWEDYYWWENSTPVPFIDHLHYDDSGWLFGTTGHSNNYLEHCATPIIFAIKFNNSNQRINPNSEYRLVELASFDIHVSSYIVGLYEKILDCGEYVFEYNSGFDGNECVLVVFNRQKEEGVTMGAYILAVDLASNHEFAYAKEIRSTHTSGAIHQGVFTDFDDSYA